MRSIAMTGNGTGTYTRQLYSHSRAAGGRLTFSSSLPFTDSIKQGIGMVSKRISRLDHIDFSGKELFTPVAYALKRPGKMIRPALVFLGARLVGDDVEEYVDLATSAEMLHTASLVHDDIIDGDTVRRGAPALRVKHGQEAALLTGDALTAKAVSLAARYGPEAVKTMADASLSMCAGELIDRESHNGRKSLNVREYLRLARLKTGVFMGACASIAAVCRDNKKSSQLYAFGLSLGVAFQLRDDIIERIDTSEARENGGAATGSPNIIDVFARQFGTSEKDAAARATELNNYFADMAAHIMEGERARAGISSYVNFVRIRSS